VGAGHYRDRNFGCQEKYCAGAPFRQNDILWTVKLISTAEAAKRLNVTPSRVRAMIARGRLKAMRVGIMWLIDPKDLDAVKNRKVGRPRKTAKRRSETKVDK
jgi:excisionase family DNA binding protein